MSKTPLIKNKRSQKAIVVDDQCSQLEDNEDFLRKSQYNKSIYDDKGSQNSNNCSNSVISNFAKSQYGQTQKSEKAMTITPYSENPENFEVPQYDPRDQLEDEEDQKILILKEPTNCTIIPTIEEEKKLLDCDNDGLPQKPVDTYLINFDQMLKDGGRINSEYIQDDQIANCFQTDGMRIFLDYIYNNQKQYLLIKTWQKISLTQPKPRERKKYQELINKLLKSPAVQKRNNELPIKAPEQQQDDTSFYIKTFQVFDKLGQALSEPVLVEQVFGKFDDYRVYDTSTLFKNGKLYYFKRLFIDGGDSQDIGFSEESSEAGNILNSLNNTSDNLLKLQFMNIFKKLLKQKQILMLHSFDIKTKKEVKIQNIFIDEEDNNLDYYRKLQNFLHTRKNLGLNNYRIFRPQNMVQMSNEFGPHLYQKYENDYLWLKEQFFAIQKYTQTQEANIFKIYKIDDYTKKSINEFLIHQMESSEQKEKNDCIRQIQYFNHIRDYDKKEAENNTVSFLATNMKLIVQIQYNNKKKQFIRMDQFKRKSADIFQKIFNNGGIIAQMTKITHKDGGGNPEDFDQYFYVDSRNQIQLLYPQIEQKVQKLKIIDIIAKKNKIKPKDPCFYKKIACITHNSEQDVQIKNTVQKFENLRQIIDFEEINSRQSIFYLKDSESEKLYITEPSAQNILIFYLENSNQIQCKILDESNMLNPQKGGKSGDKDKESETNQNLKVASKNKEQPTTQTGFDHEEPYLVYKQKQSKKSQKKGQSTSLDEKERKNHILIDDFNGNQMKVKTYDINSVINPQQQLRCILYQQSHGGEYCFFLFVVQNILQLGESEDAFSDTRIIKKSYVFVRKSLSQMKYIFNSECREVIIQCDDKVLIMKNNLVLEDIKFCDIREFQFRKEFLEKEGIQGIKDTDEQIQTAGKFETPYIEIKIVISKAEGDKCRINFVPMVYQEKQSSLTLKMMLFDIVKFQITQNISIGPAKHNQDYMYEDEQGYKKFWLCRTSDLHEEYQNQMSYDSLIQRTKYQLFTLYQEKIGRIMGEEFLIVFEKSGSRIQTIGQKHIVLSQNIIQDCEWTNIRDSTVLPFYDNFGSVKGCQFMLKTSSNSFSQIQLCDQNMNNIYGYKSKILVSGKKQFQISKNSADEHYVVIISALLRRNIIIKMIFDRQEAFIILERSLNLMLSMRVPDLEFLVYNTFEDLKSQDFFQSQEILLGKSICDICLSDPDSIHYATNLFDCRNGTFNASGSIIEMIIKNDLVRKQTFIQTQFYPTQLIIQIDLNQVGTIRRALFYSNIKSLKILLNFCFKIIDQFEYQPFIMFDLGSIILSSQVQINDFFNISKTEKKDMEIYGFCNIEIEFKNPDLPVFHDKPFDFFIIQEFENFLQTGRDILRDIQHHNDQIKEEKTNEIEYYYIDFSNMHVGEKIKHIDCDQPIKFDDLFYSRLMKIKCDQGSASSSFFAQESIQKIIDSQWVLTKAVQKQIFIIYILLYCVPMCVSSFKIQPFVDNLMFKIALIPACMLGFIEFIQLQEQKWTYFKGWNIIDTMQIFIYGLLFYMLLTENTEVLFFPELKLINIILAFMKILFFIRIYEKFGFLVQMIVSCIVALVPFIMAFLVFVLVFAVCYVVLQLELDMDESEAKGLSYFQKMVLQTFKNSIGELMMPKYTLISAQEESFFKHVNIFLIWFIWCMHTFFQLVIMLNFLIAVISSNYEESAGIQVLIGYQQKAELNYETYMLLNVFKKLDEYKCLVLQCSKSGDEFTKDKIGEKMDDLKKFIELENKSILGDYNKLNDSMDHVKKAQERIDSTIFQKFLQLQNSQNLTREQVLNTINPKKSHSHSHGHHHK